LNLLRKLFGGDSEKPDPDAPVFELFVEDAKVAHLHDPKREEMCQRMQTAFSTMRRRGLR